MSICKDKRYEILEEFAREEVLSKHSHRQCFLNEVLKKLQYYEYNYALENHMVEKGYVKRK